MEQVLSSKTIKDLKDYSHEKQKPGDRERLVEELNTASDRARIIVYATFVEDAIQSAIERRMSHLNKTELDDLFGPLKPLGAFSAKINVAYAMRVYGPKTKRDLHTLREMRNACAHSKRPISFETAVLTNASLLIPDLKSWVPPHPTNTFLSRLRRQFRIKCIRLISATELADNQMWDDVTRFNALP